MTFNKLILIKVQYLNLSRIGFTWKQLIADTLMLYIEEQSHKIV